MASANVGFSNLRAEMARNNVTIMDIAQAICVSRDTAGKKLSRRAPIQLDEAFAIINTFFPGMDVCYLFAEASPNAQAG